METGLQFSKLIGILWPLDLFKNAVNRDPKPAEISVLLELGEVKNTACGLVFCLWRSLDLGASL